MQRYVQSLKEVSLELWPNVKGEDGEIQKRNPKSLGWTDCGNSEEPLKNLTIVPEEYIMKPIPNKDRRVANIFKSVFTPIQSNGKPDGEVLQLNDDKPLGSGFYIYKMEPGAATVPHKHTGDEEFLIIQGDLTDHDGVDYGPGDMVWLRDGTVHNSTTKNGCLIAVYALEPDF